jgi:hypothetical protein
MVLSSVQMASSGWSNEVISCNGLGLSEDDPRRPWLALLMYSSESVGLFASQ